MSEELLDECAARRDLSRAAKGGSQISSDHQEHVDLIGIVNPDGTMRHASPSHERVLGYSAEELVGKSTRQFELDAIVSTLQLELADSTEAANTMPEAHADSARGQPLHVLLAEDNVVNQRLVLRVLGKRGHIVLVVSNGKDALAAVGQYDFDVVLMDVQMPVMDGFESTAAIRAHEHITGLHVPIVALTAHALKGDAERCLQAGMDGYIAKPIRSAELMLVIENISQARRAAA